MTIAGRDTRQQPGHAQTTGRAVAAQAAHSGGRQPGQPAKRLGHEFPIPLPIFKEILPCCLSTAKKSRPICASA